LVALCRGRLRAGRRDEQICGIVTRSNEKIKGPNHGNAGSCGGDSGAPLVRIKDGHIRLVALDIRAHTFAESGITTCTLTEAFFYNVGNRVENLNTMMDQLWRAGAAGPGETFQLDPLGPEPK
jgi:hypothetical protein